MSDLYKMIYVDALADHERKHPGELVAPVDLDGPAWQNWLKCWFLSAASLQKKMYDDGLVQTGNYILSIANYQWTHCVDNKQDDIKQILDEMNAVRDEYKDNA